MPRKKTRVISLPQRRLATIMFTDIVGYTALTQENESLALELLEKHRQLLRPHFDEHDGHEIKTMGDAFLVEFASARSAAHCAIAMQKTMRKHNASASSNKRLGIRIGMHLGDVEYRDNDVYGDGVNIASRIEPLGQAGDICISEDLARQIQNKITAPVVRLGRSELKNVQLPMEIYRIVPPWETHRPALLDRLRFSLRSQHQRMRLTVGIAVLVIVGMMWMGRRDSTSTASLPVESVPETNAVDIHPIEAGLHSFLASGISPASVRITYEELHPPREGDRIVILGTGEIQQTASAEGDRFTDLRLAEMENLVRVLIDIAAWEQRVAWRASGSEESRAYLRIQVAGSSSEIWEWYDELDDNLRIIQVIDQLKKFSLWDEEPLAPPPRHQHPSQGTPGPQTPPR